MKFFDKKYICSALTLMNKWFNNTRKLLTSSISSISSVSSAAVLLESAVGKARTGGAIAAFWSDILNDSKML